MGYGTQMGTFGCGSVTDGTNKLEIRIVSFHERQIFQKGQKLEIMGTVEYKGLRLYLQANYFNDIRVVGEEIMPLQQLLAGFKDLKRPLIDGEEPSNSRRRS